MEAKETARLNVGLIEEAYQALEAEKEASGLNTADVTNRALQLYNYLMAEERAGSKVAVVVGKKVHQVTLRTGNKVHTEPQ